MRMILFFIGNSTERGTLSKGVYKTSSKRGSRSKGYSSLPPRGGVGGLRPSTS